jgi:hypothetical protein
VAGEDPNDSVGQGAAPPRLTVKKITWALVGRVTEPGRYIFTFGWLTAWSGPRRFSNLRNSSLLIEHCFRQIG